LQIWQVVVYNVCFAERFLTALVTQQNDVSFSREKMTSLNFTDEDITCVFLLL